MAGRIAAVALVLAVTTAGCSYGMTAARFRPAESPQGVMLRLTTDTRQYDGELIEVRPDGILVLADGRLWIAPYGTIVASRIEQVSSDYALGGGSAPRPEVQEQLRLLSRFPAGLTPGLLKQLLALHGQTELVVAR